MNDPTAIRPKLGENVYIAPTAYVGGDVAIGSNTTIMHQVVVRGDVSSITIGNRVNIQDASIVHTKKGVPLVIEDEVTIGHRAVVHCKHVGRGALIGIGSIVLDDAEIGPGAIIAAGAVVPPGTIVPSDVVMRGIPAREGRALTDDDRRYMQRVVREYQELGRAHAAGRYPPATI